MSRYAVRGHDGAVRRGTRLGLNAYNIFVGPAHGPRYMCTVGFDHSFYTDYNTGLIRGERWLVGGSAGALRFCALLRSIVEHSFVPADALFRRFTTVPCTPDYTAEQNRECLDSLLHIATSTDPTTRVRMLTHPQIRLAVYVCQLPLWLGRVSRRVQFAALVLLALLALVGLEKLFSHTLCFYSGINKPPFARDHDNVRYLPLTQDNFQDVVRASGTIPGLIASTMRIHGMPDAYYCDAALVHYELGFWTPRGCATLLLSDKPRIYPNVFRQVVERPTPTPPRTAVLFPTEDFIKHVPERSLPSVADWFKSHYVEDPTLRMHAWRTTYDLSVESMPRTPRQWQEAVNVKHAPPWYHRLMWWRTEPEELVGADREDQNDLRHLLV